MPVKIQESRMKNAPQPSPDTVQDPVLLTKIDKGIATLTLNRPKQRNSLSTGLMSALQFSLDECAENPAVRVIVLAGSGPVFSSGHDLKELTAERAGDDQGRAFYAEIMAQCAKMMQTIVRHPKPVIARVHGVATAAGCQLVASCDLAIATTMTRFATPGVNIGLFCSTPMVALSRNVSRKHAMEMLLTGEMMDAQTAERFGLINRAVHEDKLDEEVYALAGTIAAKSSKTLAIGKQAFYDQIEMPMADAYAYASEVMIHNMMTHDAEEGIGAFIEKREPEWKDR